MLCRYIRHADMVDFLGDASEVRNMMLKAKGERGRGVNTLMVAACMWPRSRHAGTVHMPIKPRGQYSDMCVRDRADILAYIARNGPCTRFDIELECHQSQTPVLRHLAALRAAGSIERYHDSYQVI